MTSACKEIRQDILRIARLSGYGHIPSCFSVIEILYAVYANIRHDPQNPLWPERDIFILSKGHASLGHYCLLAKFGYFQLNQVNSFAAFMSDFGGHADRLKVPGVEASTGSLGHGIGMAVGMAMALKIKKGKNRVFVLIGDGEANEGSVWEAILVAANLRLTNLTIIYDDNCSHSRGLQIENPLEKMQAFGCTVSQVDGHDIAALAREINKRPVCLQAIVANTKKGFGCQSFMDNHYAWHRRSPNETEFNMLMRELNEKTI